MFILKHYDTSLCRFDLTDDPLDGQNARIVWHLRASLPGALKSYCKAMMMYMPFRAIASFSGGHLTYDGVQALVDKINEQ